MTSRFFSYYTKILPLFFGCLLYLNTSAQWIELNGIGINQPYSHLPGQRIATICETSGNYVYLGLGHWVLSSAQDIYYDDYYKYDLLTGQWQQSGISNTISARAKATSVSYNGKFYIGFGENDLTFFNDFWELDPATGVSTQLATGPSWRINAIGFVSGNKAYVGGGETLSGPADDFYSYDFATNTWQQEGNLPSLYLQNGGALVLEIDGSGYLLFSRDTLNALTHPFIRYNSLSNNWTYRTSYPGHGAGGVTGFGFNDQAFVGFGSDTTNNFLSEFFQYDALNDNWIQKNSYNKIKWSRATFSNGIRAGIIGLHGSLHEYDVVTDSWQEKVGIPFTTPSKKMVVLNNKAYGYQHIYDIATDTWSSDTTLKVYWSFEIGGVAYGYHQGTFSRFDPGTSTFTPLTQPPVGLQNFFSIGNKGYGGEFYDTPTKGFWEYDTQTDQWTRKADFTGPKRDCNGGFSIGNKGYITGGWCDSVGWYIFDFWQYDPQTDSWSKKADGGPTGFVNGIMAGDATRGYVGLGAHDYISADVGFISVYDPGTDTWTSLPNLSARRNAFYFIANDALYTGGGYKRLNSQDALEYYDVYKLPLAGINSLGNIAGENSFDVFPNPSSGRIYLRNFTGKTINVYNMQGKRVLTINNENTFIDLRGKLESDCYIITGEDIKYAKKIVLIFE